MRRLVGLAWLALSMMLAFAGCSDGASPSTDAGVSDSGRGAPNDASFTPVDAGTRSDGGQSPDSGVIAVDGEVSIRGVSTPMTVQTQRVFAAPIPVTWSVSANGGSITERGVYTAPATPTLATISATSQADPSRSAKVAIEIVALPIAILTAPAVMTVSTSVSASVLAQDGATYAWTLVGGTIAGDTNGDSVTFSATRPGTLLLTCVVTNKAGSAVSGSATIGVFATPVVSISAPSSTTSGVVGLVAKVPVQTGATYAWTITGGTITAGQDAASIKFTAGAAGTLTLGCTVTAGGKPVSGSAEVTVHPALVSLAIVAPDAVTASSTNLAASVTAQTGMTYSWSISGGTLSGGQGTNAITFASTSVGPITLTCVLTNGAGATESATKVILVVARPSMPVLTAPSAVTGGSTGNRASASFQPGLTYQWSITGGSVKTSDANNVVFDADLKGTLVITCVATNSVGTSVTATANVPIVNVPIAAITTVAKMGGGTHPASVTPQTGATYAWTIEGGTISSGAGTPDIELSADAAADKVILRVTVTNPAGTAVSGVAEITVTRGTLVITLSGAPPNASVTVSGPGGFVESINLTSTTTLTELEPGTYRVDVPETFSNYLTYTPVRTPSNGEVAVTNNASASFSAVFTTHNDAPEIIDPLFYDPSKPYRAVTTTLGTPAVFPATAIDPEGGPVDLTFVVPANKPSGLAVAMKSTVSGTGERTVTLTPSGKAGVHEIGLEYCDSAKKCAGQTIFLLVLPSSGPSPIVTAAQDLPTTAALASPGDVITFHPELIGVLQSVSTTLVSKDLTIYGQSPERTILGVTSGNGITVKGANLTLIGVTVDGASNAGGGSGISATGATQMNVTVRDCILRNNVASDGSAIYFSPTNTLSFGVYNELVVERTKLAGNGVDVSVVSVGATAPNRLVMRESYLAHDGGTGIQFEPTRGDGRLSQNTFVTNKGTTIQRTGGSSTQFWIAQSTFSATAAPSFALSSTGGAPIYVGGSVFDGYPQDSTVVGAAITYANNLLSSTDTKVGAPNLVGVPAGLGSLTTASSERSWLMVRVPQAGSVGIGQMSATMGNCRDAEGTLLATDQRGLPRTSPCDMGSVERQSTDP